MGFAGRCGLELLPALAPEPNLVLEKQLQKIFLHTPDTSPLLLSQYFTLNRVYTLVEWVCIKMNATRGDNTLYFTEATAHSAAYFGEGNGTIHFDFVQCSSSAQNLTQCNTRNSGSSNHSLDVGVKCQPGIFYIHAFILSQKNRLLPQLKDHTGREIFVWWEDLTTGREEW